MALVVVVQLVVCRVELFHGRNQRSVEHESLLLQEKELCVDERNQTAESRVVVHAEETLGLEMAGGVGCSRLVHPAVEGN